MAAVTEATAKRFFSSPLFAVVGASSNPAKFGHKGSILQAPQSLFGYISDHAKQ